MSEPVTQAEIEDVLSSIRRLVSEDAREARGEPVAESAPAEPEATAASAAVEAAPSPKSVTRLVLTPALRVNDAEAQPEPIQPPVSTAAAEAAEDAVAPSVLTEEALEYPVQEEDSVQSFSETDAIPEPETDLEDAAPWKDPWATLYQAAGVSGAEEADAELIDVPDGEAAPSEAFQEPSDRVSAVVQKITELEVKVARSQEQWEPDGRTADPFAGSNIETLQWHDHCEEEEVEEAHLTQQEPQTEVQFHHHEPQQHEPSQSPSQSGEDLLEAALAGSEEEITAQALEALAGEEAFIDEESLRELVADIVREELQGALGERITRNVRKLVRREIHRALAAQDLL
ncbi:hypothetical protein PXK07_01715 [Phaeobacter sp. QD34_24]|nr:hypothetical protein [Phaeobacter sp. QD34_24]